MHLASGATTTMPALTDVRHFGHAGDFALGIERETGDLIYYELDGGEATVR